MCGKDGGVIGQDRLDQLESKSLWEAREAQVFRALAFGEEAYVVEDLPELVDDPNRDRAGLPDTHPKPQP